jgi:hypothetical protein
MMPPLASAMPRTRCIQVTIIPASAVVIIAATTGNRGANREADQPDHAPDSPERAVLSESATALTEQPATGEQQNPVVAAT